MAASKTEHDLLGSVIGYIGNKDSRVTGSSLPVYKGKLEVKRDTRPLRTPAQQAAVDAYLKKYTEVRFPFPLLFTRHSMIHFI
jgi:hypothetical protein